MTKANELTFQTDLIRQLTANGWQPGQSERYNRELALYPEDLPGLVQGTPPPTLTSPQTAPTPFFYQQT